MPLLPGQVKLGAMCVASIRSPRPCTTSGVSGLVDGGKHASAKRGRRAAEQAELDRLKRRVGQLERALGHKTYELEVAGELAGRSAPGDPQTVSAATAGTCASLADPVCG